MDVAVSERSATTVGRALRTFIDKLGLPDPENPQPPGPWDPVIRAINLSLLVAGPVPDPWRLGDLIAGPFPQPWRMIDRVAGPLPDPWMPVAYDVYGSLASPPGAAPSSPSYGVVTPGSKMPSAAGEADGTGWR